MATANVMIADRDSEVVLTHMTEHDLLEVVEIEEGSGLSPWGWDAYHKELQSPAEVLMLVARVSAEKDRIAGFIGARLVGGELHVYNVAVREKLRQRGIASRLLEAALDWGKKNRAQLAFLEVREGNKTAQALYTRCGFVVTGRRNAYYNAPVDDALLMTVSLELKP